MLPNVFMSALSSFTEPEPKNCHKYLHTLAVWGCVYCQQPGPMATDLHVYDSNTIAARLWLRLGVCTRESLFGAADVWAATQTPSATASRWEVKSRLWEGKEKEGESGCLNVELTFALAQSSLLHCVQSASACSMCKGDCTLFSNESRIEHSSVTMHTHTNG